MQDTIREDSPRYNHREADELAYLESESDLSLDLADIVPRKRLHTEPEQSQRNYLDIENQVLLNLGSF